MQPRLPRLVRRLAGILLYALITAGATSAAEDPPPHAGVDYWNKRLGAALKTHDAQEEVLSLSVLLRQWGFAFSAHSEAVIGRVVADSSWAHIGQPRVDLLRQLFDMRWKLDDDLEPSRQWRELSLALWEQGQRDDALAVAAHVFDPYQVMIMQVDARYRVLLKAPGLESNVDKAARADIARRRMLIENYPHSLALVVSLARAMWYARQGSDALRLTDEALSKAAASPAGYDDAPREMSWLLWARAKAFAELGRYEEGIEQLRRAREIDAKSGAIALDLARALSETERAREALAVLPEDEVLSPYGLMVKQSLSAIIASQLGDAAAATRALDYLRQHRDMAPGSLEEALLADDRMDEAATLMVTRLSDPEQRADALRWLQDYGEQPAPPARLRWRARLKALRNRPEVRTEVAAVGRIERSPLLDLSF
jgi:beta-barrel assembly-enhancing protease